MPTFFHSDRILVDPRHLLTGGALRVAAIGVTLGSLAFGHGVPSVQAQQVFDCGAEGQVASVGADQPFQLTISNSGDATRDVYWLDENGERSFTASVSPGDVYQVDTWVGHYFVVVDPDSGECQNVIQAG